MRTLSYVSYAHDQVPECENLVLMCMDFRFHEKIAQIIAHSGYRQFDLVALPGGSQSLTDDRREAVLSAIELGVSVHKVRRVIIVDHVDCRAFGGSEAFASPEQEEQHHADSLAEAARVIRDRFPELEVVPVYTSWDRIRVLD